jgi:hypothetical protein
VSVVVLKFIVLFVVFQFKPVKLVLVFEQPVVLVLKLPVE